MATLFDIPVPPVPPAPTPASAGLARASDPETSKAAAASLDLSFSKKLTTLLYLLWAGGPMTDDQLADRAVKAGLYQRHEQARRGVRTLREVHGVVVPYLGSDGVQVQYKNASGRMALAWLPADDVIARFEGDSEREDDR